MSFILLDANLPFAVALALTGLLGAISLLGLDVDGNAIDIPLLDWSNPENMPMLAWLATLLSIYGLGGLGIQEAATSLLGQPLDPLAAGLAVAPAALVANRPVSRAISLVMPKDETTAIPLALLVGTRGRIEIGLAYEGHPARARFRDAHGQVHYVMVEPTDSEARLGPDHEILLVSLDGPNGRVVAVEPNPFVNPRN